MDGVRPNQAPPAAIPYMKTPFSGPQQGESARLAALDVLS